MNICFGFLFFGNKRGSDEESELRMKRISDKVDEGKI
jgi:hypothetical protein